MVSSPSCQRMISVTRYEDNSNYHSVDNKKYSTSTNRWAGLLAETIRRRHRDATDHDISEPIKSWLRHASERTKKEDVEARNKNPRE